MRSRRQTLFASLALTGVFVLGAVTGIVAAGTLAHRHLRQMFQGTPEEVDTRVTQRVLGGALRLSDDERRRVGEVLEKNAAEHSRLRNIIEPDLAKLRVKERDEIRAVLRPDRRDRFDKVIVEVDERRSRLERLLDH